jgi:rhodanese-related sulfurtransferase
MPQTVKALLDQANAAVPRVSVADAKAMLDRGDAVALDVRDASEVAQSGKVPGALTIPRGMLEFKVDPGLPTYEPRLRPDKTIILYCGSGGRSALAGKMLRDFGYQKVLNLGGFKSWAEAGLPVERL